MGTRAWEIENDRLPAEPGRRITIHAAADLAGSSEVRCSRRTSDRRSRTEAYYGLHWSRDVSPCSTSIDIEVDRNPKAVLAKQPAFVIIETGTTLRNKSLGHLFIGTILSSPVLYYGSINHCGHEQWITLFFNRALRDRSDHHLTIMQSTSGQPEASSGGDEAFGLS